MNDSSNGSRKRNPLPPQVRAAIGQKLKDSLAPVVAEAVPDRFLRLLDELEQRTEEAPGAVPPAIRSDSERRKDH